MNERIEKLVEQAKTHVLARIDEHDSDWDDQHTVLYNQKFAELIVRECTSKCEFVANMATITNTGEMARKTKATADSCATMIKEHFGVEE